MSWPGTPKSQQSPPINQPSVRIVPPLNEHSTMADVTKAIKTAFDGLTVHEQSFAALKGQTTSNSGVSVTETITESAGTVIVEQSGVTAFNAQTGPIIYFPGMGLVNNQLGEPSYAPIQGDAGKKIIVGDSSAVAIYLDSSLAAPWFAIIDNDSSAIVNLSAQGPLYGAQTIPSGGFGIVFYDGVNWWAGATPTSGGGSGVSSLNGLIGALSLESTDDSIVITPGGSSVNLEVNQGGSVTAANFSLGPGAGTGASINVANGTDGSHYVSIEMGSSAPSTGIIYTFTPTGGSRSGMPVFNMFPGPSVSISPPFVGGGGSSYTMNQDGGNSSLTGYDFTVYWPN